MVFNFWKLESQSGSQFQINYSAYLALFISKSNCNVIKAKKDKLRHPGRHIVGNETHKTHFTQTSHTWPNLQIASMGTVQLIWHNTSTWHSVWHKVENVSCGVHWLFGGWWDGWTKWNIAKQSGPSSNLNEFGSNSNPTYWIAFMSKGRTIKWICHG